MRIRKLRFEIVEWKIVPSFGSDLESSFVTVETESFGMVWTNGLGVLRCRSPCMEFCGGGKSAPDVYDHTIVCGDILVNVLNSLRPL